MAVSAVVSRSKVLFQIEFRRAFNLTCVIGVTDWNNGVGSCCSPRRYRHTRRICTSARHSVSTTHPTHCATPPSGPTSEGGSVWSTESALKPTPADPALGGVTVEYSRGLPVVTVPLPSRRERCRFTLRPISHTVGDFQNMLAREDRGIDRVSVTTLDGVRIASSNTIESLMENDFRLVLNDTMFEVLTPRQERLSQEEVRQLSDVRNLVNQLYEALNVGEHQLQKERELFTQLEDLKEQLEPMEKKRKELEGLSEKRTTVLTWVGLGMMSVQFGILARLTWWEYSWDIMEPVTYFVTYGTAMAAYAYFVLTKQEYLLPDVKDRQFLITFHKKAKKIGLNVHRYNNLRDSIARIEDDLRRLRDPLQIHLPPSHLNDTTPFGNLTDKHGAPILSPFARAHEQIRNLLKRNKS